MKLSAKKENQLWKTVSDQIMDARIEIAMIQRGKPSRKTIDDILFDLSISAPNAAVNVFKKNMKLKKIKINGKR